MTAKHRKFVAEYLKDGNGTRAAIAAGYPQASAHVAASRLLKTAKVRAQIDKVNAKGLAKAEVTVEKLSSELKRIGFSNLADYVRIDDEGQADIDLSRCTREQLAAVQEITVDTTGGTGDGERRRVLRTRLKLIPKIPALELLSRRFNEFSQKQQHTGSDGGPIKASITVNFVQPNDNQKAG